MKRKKCASASYRQFHLLFHRKHFAFKRSHFFYILFHRRAIARRKINCSAVWCTRRVQRAHSHEGGHFYLLPVITHTHTHKQKTSFISRQLSFLWDVSNYFRSRQNIFRCCSMFHVRAVFVCLYFKSLTDRSNILELNAYCIRCDIWRCVTNISTEKENTNRFGNAQNSYKNDSSIEIERRMKGRQRKTKDVKNSGTDETMRKKRQHTHTHIQVQW